MAKPILFLDVDGVLNIEQHETNVPHDEWYPGSAEHCFIPHGTKERLARILEVYDPCWSTAWMGAAHETFGSLLDLGDSWPHIEYFGLKLPEMIKYANGLPWVWVDDDARYELRDLGWEPYERYVDGLIIIPNRRVGITDEHVDQLLEFAKDHNG